MRIRLNLAVKNYENSRTYPEVDAFLDYSNISSWRLRENNVVGILQLEQYGLPTHQLPIIADFTMTSTSRALTQLSSSKLSTLDFSLVTRVIRKVFACAACQPEGSYRNWSKE